jgi:transcriptional regulator GlxA family with amidase domain
MVVDQPSVLFYPQPFRHRFISAGEDGAELVCATVEFGAGMLNPLMRTLPEVLVVPLASASALEPTVDLLFAEAFAELPGRQAAVDRLAEYFLVLLLRAAMDARLVRGGALMGLGDPRLERALHVIHERPEYPWSLEQLAQTAGMSRPRFAVYFKQIVGVTPFDYLTDWRIGLAQSLLRRGDALKIVAPAVGFASSTALSRAFSRRLGESPTAWLSHYRSTHDEAGQQTWSRN